MIFAIFPFPNNSPALPTPPAPPPCPLKYFKKFVWLCWVLVAACKLLWNVGSSSLTRDWTQVPCIGNMESSLPDHQGRPTTTSPLFLFCQTLLWRLDWAVKLFALQLYHCRWDGEQNIFSTWPLAYLCTLVIECSLIIQTVIFFFFLLSKTSIHNTL